MNEKCCSRASTLVILIGTSHSYQFGGSALTPSQNEAFASLIRSTCKLHDVRCLAEEMSHDALSQHGLTESTVARLANELGIAHRYCDPSNDEQTKMGVKIERNANALVSIFGWTDSQVQEGIVREHRMREQHWLSKIIELNTWPCLFVCGSKHVLPFESLLQENGLRAILVEQWDATPCVPLQ